MSVYFKFTEKLNHLWENNRKLVSSVHVLVSDKYTVFNSVHLVKGKCIVERIGAIKQKQRASVTK